MINLPFTPLQEETFQNTDYRWFGSNLKPFDLSIPVGCYYRPGVYFGLLESLKRYYGRLLVVEFARSAMELNLYVCQAISAKNLETRKIEPNATSNGRLLTEMPGCSPKLLISLDPVQAIAATFHEEAFRLLQLNDQEAKALCQAAIGFYGSQD